jgi:chemotaxis receptor (MCP) glutamine deamidase CheD
VVLVVDELVDVVELDVEVVDDSVELVANVVVLGSCVSMTDITESGSTINT